MIRMTDTGGRIAYCAACPRKENTLARWEIVLGRGAGATRLCLCDACRMELGELLSEKDTRVDIDPDVDIDYGQLLLPVEETGRGTVCVRLS